AAVNLFNLAVAPPLASRAASPAEFKSRPKFVSSGLWRKMGDRWRPGGTVFQPDPPPPAPPRPAETFPADPNVTMLAMINHPLRKKSPDPDLALPWPSQG